MTQCSAVTVFLRPKIRSEQNYSCSKNVPSTNCHKKHFSRESDIRESRPGPGHLAVAAPRAAAPTSTGKPETWTPTVRRAAFRQTRCRSPPPNPHARCGGHSLSASEETQAEAHEMESRAGAGPASRHGHAPARPPPASHTETTMELPDRPRLKPDPASETRQRRNSFRANRPTLCPRSTWVVRAQARLCQPGSSLPHAGQRHGRETGQSPCDGSGDSWPSGFPVPLTQRST